MNQRCIAPLLALPLLLVAPHGARALPDDTLGMAMFGALIAADGTLISSSGPIGSTRTEAGVYRLDFDRDVSGCYFSATPYTAFNRVIVQPASGTPKSVYVWMKDQNGTNSDALVFFLGYCAR